MAGENYSVLLKAITATEPTFNVSLRGYDRRQVDQYAHRTEAQLASTLVENRDLAGQLNAITEELRAAQNEVFELRQGPPITDDVSFKHLGLRIEQILTDAHEESDYVRRCAVEEAEQVRAQLVEEVTRERTAVANETARERAEVADEVARLRSEVEEEVSSQRGRLAEEVHQAREMEARVLNELDEARRACAAEEVRAAQEVERSTAEVARAALELDRLRIAADQLLATAQEEYERVTNSAMETAERIHADLAVQTRALREEAHEEAASVTLAAQTYAEQILAEAERHAAEVNEMVQQYSARLSAIEAPPRFVGRHSRELSSTSMRALSDRPTDDPMPVAADHEATVTVSP
jgi:hypothetical protein